MRRVPAFAAVGLLVLLLLLAGCGGTHTTAPANTGSRNVTKPLTRAIVVRLRGVLKGSVRLRRVSNVETSVVLDQGTGTGSRVVSVELDRGSCGAPKGLQVLKALGKETSTGQHWVVDESLTELTSGPLAFVIRGARGGVTSCGQVRAA